MHKTDDESNTQWDSSSSKRLLTDKNSLRLDRNRKSESDNEPFEYHLSQSNLTDLQVAMHLIKGSVGTGVLAMPAAIKDAGLIFGTVTVILSSIIITHSMQLLIQSCQYIRSIHDQRVAKKAQQSNTEDKPHDDGALDHNSELSWQLNLDYYQTVRLSFLLASGSSRLKQLSWLASVLNVCLIIGQIGFLGVYQIFVAQNTLYMVKDFQQSSTSSTEPIWPYLLGVYVILLPLVFIKSLHRLAFLSVVANVLGVGSLLLILFYCFNNLQPVTSLPYIRDMNTLPLSFGVIVFAFESINVLLPLENQMLHKSHLLGSNSLSMTWHSCASSVLTVTMTIVASLYLAVGFYGFLRFGMSVEGAITYNIPSSPWIFALVKPAYTLSVLISYTLQFYVLYTALCTPVLKRLHSRLSPIKLTLVDGVLRGALVTGAFILALLVPHVELMISFFGSLAGAAVVLIFPPLIHSVNMWIRGGQKWTGSFCWLLSKNTFIMFYGVVGAMVGCGVSLKAIFEDI